MLDFSREFLVLARSANFVKAASELHISQPSLTRHIASLERELGFRLLNRRTMNLTSAGRFYLGAISNLITELDEIVEQGRLQHRIREHVAATEQTPIRTLRLAAQRRPTLYRSIGVPRKGRRGHRAQHASRPARGFRLRIVDRTTIGRVAP